MKMCWIPPGEFVMGSPPDEPGCDDDETQHRVKLTQGFWLGKYEVTQAQWEAVMGSNSSKFKGADLPIESVSWKEISGPGGFLEKANRAASTGGRFHLPTEAQWEYACRAGTTTALNSGKNLTSKTGACPNLDEVAWYDKNSGGKTNPVGTKSPNSWGLHDMHGNVWEWCVDSYGSYPDSAETDPQGAGMGSDRVDRGGGWNSNANNCRVANRNYYYPGYSNNNLGFRMARTERQGSAKRDSKVTVSGAAPDIPVGMSLIAAGPFQMGESVDGISSATTRTVTLSAFYMGQKEVTKAEWDAVKAWAVSHGYTDLATGGGKAANHPVQTVTWFDAIKWCNARSEKEGLAPCYTVNGSFMKTGNFAPTVNWTATGYRLPTEAEWEKAARGGLSEKRFPWGDTKISHALANFKNGGNEAYQTGTAGFHPTYGIGSEPHTSPVGSFTANGYGLYDMAGNVWEWCWDWAGTSASGAQTDPRGAASGSGRILHGGSWADNALTTRCAYHDADLPHYRNNSHGFRIARSVVPYPSDASAELTATYLDDLAETDVKIGWGTLGKHGCFDAAGGKLGLVQGASLSHSLSAHPPWDGSSSVSYHLDGKYSTFKGVATLRDNFHPAAPVTFSIIGDGVTLWQSPQVTEGAEAQKFSISVKNTKVLTLKILCHGSNQRFAGVWAYPRLLK